MRVSFSGDSSAQDRQVELIFRLKSDVYSKLLFIIKSNHINKDKCNILMSTYFFNVLIILSCVLTQSACSISGPSPNQTQGVLYPLTEKIQNLILRCALPKMYYSNHSIKYTTILWHTKKNAVYVESIMGDVLQTCVSQRLLSQPLELHSSLSGNIEIHSS